MNENKKIPYEDFEKVELRAGKILSAEKVPNTDKLLRLMVDFGEYVAKTDGSNISIPTPRQIVSGISIYFPDPAVLVGRLCMFATNIEPRTLRGLQSDGMILALSTPSGVFSLLEPSPVDSSRGTILPGTKAK